MATALPVPAKSGIAAGDFDDRPSLLGVDGLCVPELALCEERPLVSNTGGDVVGVLGGCCFDVGDTGRRLHLMV